MKKQLCYLFFLMVGCVAHAGELSPKALHIHEQISHVDKLVEECMTLMGIPGASVGIVVGDETLLAKGYGMRDLEKKHPVTSKTMFPIGSGTKAFTSFLLGQLMDDGLLDWDDPVAEHIPHFKLKDPYTTYEITIRDYLTHTSGYPRHDGIWYGSDLSRKEVIHKLRFLEPFAPFRETFYYQQLGYMIAATAGEHAAGKTWEELTKERILQPLDMVHTNFTVADLKKFPDHSLGYRENKQKENYLTPYFDIPQIAPAGAINSNIEDMTKWVKALLKKGDGLIHESTWKEITSPQVVSNLVCNGQYGVEHIIPMEAYGLGWIIISYRGHIVLMHGGNIEGFSSNVILIPEIGVGIVILSNKHLTPFPYLLSTLLMDRMLELDKIDWLDKYKTLTEYTKDTFQKNQKTINLQRHENTTPSRALSDFQGIYLHPAYGQIEVIMHDSKLEAHFHHSHLPLNHWHYDVFEVAETSTNPHLIGLKFIFGENVYGDIDSLRIPFEPLVDDIEFLRQNDQKLSHELYLQRFTGNYSYHGFGFKIEHDCNKLVVHAMGQPPFELIAIKNNIFKVKGYDGYIVQFVTDDQDQVTAVQLTQPNSSAYTATKY